MEMQSTDYVKASLESHPLGQEFLGAVLPELTMNSSSSSGTAHYHHQSITDHHQLKHVHGISHETHFQHYQNDSTSLLWVLKKVWGHYRLGTVDEQQNGLADKTDSEETPVSTEKDRDTGSFSSSPPKLIANECKEVISRETFFILLADIIDYYFKDMSVTEKKQQLIMNYLLNLQKYHSEEKFIAFHCFLSSVLDLIQLIHSKA
jgi:hypothetical protein